MTFKQCRKSELYLSQDRRGDFLDQAQSWKDSEGQVVYENDVDVLQPLDGSVVSQ